MIGQVVAGRRADYPNRMHDRLVTVATFDDTTRAALARNLLEAEGIPAVLMDESTIAMDWLLSNAVGGIKLQVAPVDVERAEFLLARQDPDEPGPDVPEAAITAAPAAAVPDAATAIATRATAEELAEEQQAERDDANPSNQLAERAFKAALAGLILWPLHFYVIYLLLELRAAPTAVSPDRRWKVWTAALLNYAIVGPPLFVLLMLFAGLDTWLLGDRPNWEEHVFVQFDKAVRLKFPRPYGWKMDVMPSDDGPYDVRRYGTRFRDLDYLLEIYRLPPAAAARPPAAFLDRWVEDTAAHLNGRLVQAEDFLFAQTYPAKEALYTVRGGVARTQSILVGNRLYELQVTGREDHVRGPTAEKFFRSFVVE